MFMNPSTTRGRVFLSRSQKRGSGGAGGGTWFQVSVAYIKNFLLKDFFNFAPKLEKNGRKKRRGSIYHCHGSSLPVSIEIGDEIVKNREDDALSN